MRNGAKKLSKTLKDNVSKFNQDVQKKEAYSYTGLNKFSATVANKRLTRATVEALDFPFEKVLDVGCGDGTYTKALSDIFPKAHFFAFDPAEMAIERAKKAYPSEKLHFFAGNAEDPELLSGEKYDVVIIRGFLHHSLHPEKIIQNTSRFARNLIVIEPNGYNMVLKAIEKLSKYHREHEERSFPPYRVASWFRNHNYQITKREYVGFVPFFCPDLFAKCLYALQPILEKIPLLNKLGSACVVLRGKNKLS